jgi:hypothetical protein
MEGQVEQKKCGGGMHWGCCWVPMFSGLAWLIAVVSAAGAWWKTGQGVDATTHYWNALVFAVIALYGHRAKMGSCKKVCSEGSGSCSEGKC